MEAKALPTLRRSPAMDIIRLIALFCVVSIHFFNYAGFYELEVTGLRMYLCTVLRTGFMVCVPLFLMLSGYLLKNKRPDRRYYAKLIKTLVIYLLACVCCILYKAPEFHSLSQLVKYWVAQSFTVFTYQSPPYAWYVEMYIGLFLLIPYLNILHNGLPDAPARRRLIYTLLFLTALPGIINIFRFNPQWWLRPSSISNYYQFLPTWWIQLYPITYYFIGAYLHDHPLKLDRKQTLLLTLAVYLFCGSFSYYRSYGGKFLWGSWEANPSLFVVIQAVLVFHLVTLFDYTRLTPGCCRVLSWLSDQCFGAYLLSWIFDYELYALMGITREDPVCRVEYFPIMVPAILICSIALSALLSTIYQFFAKALKPRA